MFTRPSFRTWAFAVKCEVVLCMRPRWRESPGERSGEVPGSSVFFVVAAMVRKVADEVGAR